MKSILAITVLGLSLFSASASACGMPPARGMSLAKAMETIEAAPSEEDAVVVEVEPVEELPVVVEEPEAEAPKAEEDAPAPAEQAPVAPEPTA